MNSILLFILFILFIRITVRQSDFKPALILFLVATTIKILFLLFWIILKTGEFNINYLQFVDEYFYVNYEWGDPIAVFGNAYGVVVYSLQRIGFSYFDLKVLNVLATSFALVRLYSLHDLVENKNRYFNYLLVIGAILHIHVHYYSIFVLKDALIFLFTMELFVHLVRRKYNKNWLPIIATILILIQLRFSLVYLFGVFIFDKNWAISKKRFIIAIVVLFIFFNAIILHVGDIFVNRFKIAIYHSSLDLTGGQHIGTDDSRIFLISNPTLVVQLAIENVKTLFLPLGQVDLTDNIIVLVYYGVFIYLIRVTNIIMMIRTMWPILIFPFAFLIINIFSFMNNRWTIYPFATLLFAMIFVSSQPIPSLYRRSRRRKYLGVISRENC